MTGEGRGNWDELWALDRKGDVTEEVNDGRDDNESYYLKGYLRSFLKTLK